MASRLLFVRRTRNEQPMTPVYWGCFQKPGGQAGFLRSHEGLLGISLKSPLIGMLIASSIWLVNED
jgi:hypothetical protein